MVTATDAAHLRSQIAELLQNGQTPSGIAAALGCSRTTVYRVIVNGTAPDGRLLTSGARPVLTDYLESVVLDIRANNSHWGARMIAAMSATTPPGTVSPASRSRA